MALLQIKYVIMLERVRNYTTAAQKLFITQPTLSEQIKKLEKELGILLFERNTKKVVPTDAGMVFIQKGVKIVNEVDFLKKEMENFSHIRQKELIVGTLPFKHLPGLKKVIIEFIKINPDVKLKVIHGYNDELIEMLLESKCDVVISKIAESETLLYANSIKKLILQEDRACIVLNKKYEADFQEKISIAALKEKKIIFDNDNVKMKNRIESLYIKTGIKPNFALSISSMDIEEMLGFIEWDIGITYMCESICKNYVCNNNNITYAPIIPEYKINTYVIQKAKCRTSKIVEKFIKYIQITND